MHSKTYDIREFQTKEQAVQHGYDVELTSEQASKLSSMNRQQRRAWLKQQRAQAKQKAK